MLPDFAVLTGINGAGKSHLFEAIETGAVQLDDLLQTERSRPIRRFDWTNLVPQDAGAFAPYQITQEQHELWRELSQRFTSMRPQLVERLKALNRPELLGLTPRELLNLTPDKVREVGVPPESVEQLLQEINAVVSNFDQAGVAQFVSNNPAQREPFIQLIRTSGAGPLITWEEEEFYSRFPKSWQPVDMFQQSFARLFADYQRRWLNNALKRLEATEDPSVSPLSDVEFVRENGEAPWDFLNEILSVAGLDFRVNTPSRYQDRPYEPVLTDQITKAKVKFSDLSSGEKVLMSFAFCLYYAQDRRQLVNYPKALLFDEIDAPLHPSMTQSLLKTIKGTLLERHGIKVLLATHSPSTVALADEGSLYAMYKTDVRVRKTSKDAALAVLTAGVPTLSIDYENRRQVFVESQYDVRCYEAIFTKLRKRLVPEISLTFIASGVSGRGNSDQVKEVVEKLEKGGSRTVYGIVDWDLVNVATERVKVLGVAQRYSIENYLFDPLLIGPFVLREKFVDNSELGLGEGENFLSLQTFSNARLQQLATRILTQVQAKLTVTQIPTGGDDTCAYAGGQTIQVPSWFRNAQGHSLEKAIKDAFPPLKRYSKEPDLKYAIVDKIVDDLPDLVSSDFLTLFEGIQNVR